MRKKRNILLIEDNLADVTLTQIAFKEKGSIHNLAVVNDGEEALLYLHKEGQYDQAVTPDLILLDLNLPKKDGKEVLEEIMKDARLKVIPVIVLTTSDADQDIYQAYTLNANCFITKPVDINAFIDIIGYIETFWFKIVTLYPTE